MRRHPLPLLAVIIISLTLISGGATAATVSLSLQVFGTVISPTPPAASFTAAPVNGCNPLTVQFTDTSQGAPFTAWKLDFGDGSSTTTQNPSKIYTHTYTATATKTFTVTLTVTNSGGTSTATNTVKVIPPASVCAKLSASPTSGTAPLTVTFKDTSTGSCFSTWVLDFGDGTSINQPVSGTYVHTYANPGSYIAKLTLKNPKGSATASIGIKASAPPAPVASFTGTPTAGAAPLTVQFTDKSTNTPTSWAWDFDNNGVVDSNEKSPPFTYSLPGIYSVKLTVKNNGGTNSKTINNYIAVCDRAPGPDFSFTATKLKVQFTDKSTGYPTSWSWDYTNDGKADSTSQNPSYSYSKAGTYTVKLTAKNACGSTSVTKSVTVKSS